MGQSGRIERNHERVRPLIECWHSTYTRVPATPTTLQYYLTRNVLFALTNSSRSVNQAIHCLHVQFPPTNQPVVSVRPCDPDDSYKHRLFQLSVLVTMNRGHATRTFKGIVIELTINHPLW